MRVPDFIVYPVGLMAVGLAALTYWALTFVEGLATTIEARSKVIADNVTKNNAILARLAEKGLADYKRRRS